METYFSDNYNMCYYEDNIQNSQYSTTFNYDLNTYTEPAFQNVVAPQHMTIVNTMRGYTAPSSPVKYECESKNGQFRHSKSKRVRTAFNNKQILALEQEFRCSPYITRASRLELAVRIQLPELQIKIWFQNRRMKAKKDSKRVRRDSGNSSSSISDTNTPSSPENVNYLQDSQTAQDYNTQRFYDDFPYDEIKPQPNYDSVDYLIDQYSPISNQEELEKRADSGEQCGDFDLYNQPAFDNSGSEDDFFKICGEDLVNWILENSTGQSFG